MDNSQFVKPSYEAEIIDGFKVTGLMKRVWAAQIDVLNYVADICERNNLTWFADWGTLLGAVRHKGFIPWDDDIDICMKRNEYEKLIDVLHKKQLPDGWCIIHADTDNGRYSPILRIVNSSSVDFNSDFLERNHGCPYSCGIDIFPLDNVPEDEEEWELIQQLVKQIILTEQVIDSVGRDERETLLSEIEDVCGININRNMDIHKQLFMLIDALSKSYSNESCGYITNIWLYSFGYGESPMPCSWYDRAVQIPFQNIMINVPEKYEEVLITQFGKDYMTPVMNTAMHEYPYYNVQKQEAHGRLGSPEGYKERERKVAEVMDVDILKLIDYSTIY